MLRASPSSYAAAAASSPPAVKSRGVACFATAIRRQQRQQQHTAPKFTAGRGRRGNVVTRALDDGVGGSGGSGGSAAPAASYAKTWSNPTGAVLTPLVKDRVWAAERPFVWNSIDVGGKMGVVKLSDGSLW